MRVLFLENDDSFSWNVLDALPFGRADVVVRPGHEVAREPDLISTAQALVVGPGPTDPLRAGIVDAIREAARRRVPLLGICLGHQALGLAFSARLVRVAPAHGKSSTVRFSSSRLFPNFSGATETVMRYHSLALSEIPSPLRVVATTQDGIPMAIEHDTLPMAGLQFHPDSYGSPRGRELIADFFRAVI
ncbi:MAG: aminodeoxychorismate/anthranilate synthase component II [Deltaproteobacteria bacterium]|nr:aminodeoxychorismate/anthranilate synthase component II [Deltaproteobacteria bacterium]